jgi:hypothetical protein
MAGAASAAVVAAPEDVAAMAAAATGVTRRSKSSCRLRATGTPSPRPGSEHPALQVPKEEDSAHDP